MPKEKFGKNVLGVKPSKMILPKLTKIQLEKAKQIQQQREKSLVQSKLTEPKQEQIKPIDRGKDTAAEVPSTQGASEVQEKEQQTIRDNTEGQLFDWAKKEKKRG